MRLNHFRGVTILAAALVLTLFARSSWGQITAVLNSDVEGYFGAQSDTAFQQYSEGPTIPPWGVNGLGFYPVTGLPQVPALYAGFQNPSYPLTQNIGFAAPAGHSPGSAFLDTQGTTADYHVTGGFVPTGALTENAYVNFGLPGAAGMYLSQSNIATGYAYEQANFAIDFNVGPGGLVGSVPAPEPYIVSGNVTAGGYAQFGANLNYWWLTYTPGTTNITSITSLGSLQYNYQISSAPGPFSAIVSQTPAALLGATGFGILEITGDAFVAGDPSSISVSQVPEPSSIMLMVSGLAGWWLLARRRCRLPAD